MKSAILLTSFLASVAISQPHHRHQHAARHDKEKRDQSVVWTTEWDYVTEIVPVTTTIWVTPGFVAPSPTSESAATSSSSGDAGQFFETPTAQSSAPETTKSSVSVPSAPSSTYVAPSSPVDPPAYTPPVEAPTPPVVETPTYVAPVESSTPSVQVTVAPPVVNAPSSTTTPAPSPPPATTAAPAPVSTATSSGSSGGVCSSASPCSGDITYYDVGLGACGYTNVDSEAVVALPHELMGTQSNGNPYCGKTITIQHGGKSVIAKVVDKCMGCVGYAIDLSPSAFSALDSLDAGRAEATWFFND